jgi:hypothetical protein
LDTDEDYANDGVRKYFSVVFKGIAFVEDEMQQPWEGAWWNSF